MAFAVLGYLIAEIALISVVAGYLGLLATLGLLVLSAAAGVWVLRHAGGRTLGSVADTVGLRRSATPANAEREITDSLLRTGGGILLVLPGFLSSLLGLALLFPPTRAPLRTRLARRSRRYFGTGAVFGVRPGRPPFPGDAGRGDVVDGDVVDGDVIDGEVIDEVVEGTVVDDPARSTDPHRAGGGQRHPASPRQTARGEHGTTP